MTARDAGADEPVATILAMPWGPVHVAATSRGVVGLENLTTGEVFEAVIRRRLGRGPRWVDPGELGSASADPAAGSADPAALAHLRAVAAALEATLTDPGSASSAMAGIALDLDDRPAFDREVLAAVRAIPRGQTRSYGEIARAIDRHGAARAVGGAVGRNPVAMLVPCHRVVAGDGTLGGYGGGWWGDHESLLELKATLLAAEGISLPRSHPPTRRGR
ncbi:MAG: MGMT family protein [Chloroflexota bacterium]